MRAPDPGSIVHRTIQPPASAPICVQAASAWRGSVRPRRRSFGLTLAPALAVAVIVVAGTYAWSTARAPAATAVRVVAVAR